MATRAMRSPSLSSDVPSTRSAATPTLLEANPPPSFVASAEASQLVSSEVDDSVSVNVKEEAIVLLNSFLDSILYNILSTAKSVQLGRLRNAVPVVLKPRLGKAALAAADEELKEYLNEGDDDILTGSDPRSEPGNNFDLDLAWKLARLRCMVYTRLGDMEEEDEEEYIESEQLHPGSGTYTNTAHRVSSVKAASAIFLTSILEYLGEQALLYAVQNTQRRAQSPKPPVALQLDEHGPMSPPIHQSMVLDESDMFYVGRESPLSRLWRSWRRQTRLPMEMTSRQISPIQDDHPLLTEGTPQIDENAAQEEFQDSGMPHQVPLPISDNDVNEIEVPGLAREIVDDGDTHPAIPVPERSKKRPVSMVINRSDAAYHLSPESPRSMTIKQKRRSRPQLGHKRSMSHPAPEKQKFSTMADSGLEGTTTTEKKQDSEDECFQHSTSDETTEAAPAGSVQQPEEKQESKEELARPGIVITAVSAVAGTLGLGNLALATNSKDKESREPLMKPFRTAADAMIGTKPQVMPPDDAVTGSSITSVGDFDNLHIPIEKPKVLDNQESVSRLDSSDPEDLALSSGDEDAVEREARKLAIDAQPLSKEDSSLTSAFPPNSDAIKATAPEIPALDDPSPISKASNQQGIVLPTSEEPYQRDGLVANYEEPNRPLYLTGDKSVTTGPKFGHHISTIPVTSSPSSTETAINRNVASSAYAQPDKDIVREPVASRPSTATTTIQSSVPLKESSDRSGFGHTHSDARMSQYSQDSKHSSSSSKLLGFTRDNEGQPQTSAFQGPVPNGTYGYSTGSPEVGRELGSDTLGSAKEPLRIETRAGPEKHMNEAEAKKRSLEVLIRGDETLHYTLTPVPARAENFSLPGHSSDTSQNLSSRDESSAGHHPTMSNGLRSNPVYEMALPPTSRTRTAAYDSPLGSTAPVTPVEVRSRKNRAQPRDARLDNTTMMDLADYARSTGPENEQQLPKALSSRPGTAVTAKTMQSITNTIRTMPAPPMPTTRPTTQQSAGSKSVGARTRFQAREPTVARRSGTNDLIEFLKEGPPSSAGAVNGHVIDENGRASAASTQNSSVAPKSIQESMNSSTALLASSRVQPKKANGVSSSTPAAARNAALPQRDAMPARKQRRVRDPYAIDDSDDELDEPQIPARAKRTQDESLIDFLRNTAPPPGSSPPPILAGSSTASSSTAAAGAVGRQPSVQSIRERITRNTSKSSLNQKAGVNNPHPVAKNDAPPQYYRSVGRARETSPHLVQTGKKIDIYKPTTATHASHVERNRAQMKARAPTSSARTDTADLADYLKNSGPPDNPARPVRQSSIVKEEAGFLKFFSRRKAMK